MRCDHVRAGSVEEVVHTLEEAGGRAKILAGGQSLASVLALRMARPSVLVDVNRIPGLGTIRHGVDPSGAVSIEVGALVRHSMLIGQTDHPLLAEAARWIGHAAVRSRGTTGGSIAHADPTAELPAVALATGATVVVAGPRGVRTIAAKELFVGALMTSLTDDEMVTAVRFPLPTRWGFAEFACRRGDFALVTAVVTEVGGTVRVVLGGVAGVPLRAAAAERVIAAGGTAREAARAAAEEIQPSTDLRGSAPFRRAISAEMVRRALLQAGIG